ncbi:cytochrome P450 [Zopfochytrium polystomum]|nr:cytochrome P450 [Zopfochytrium polystomum]
MSNTAAAAQDALAVAVAPAAAAVAGTVRALARSRLAVAATALAAILAFFHIRNRRSVVRLPQPKPSLIVGNLPLFVKTILTRHDHNFEMSRVLGRTWTMSVPNDHWVPAAVITVDPAIVEYVLKSNVENYDKGMPFKSSFRPLLGDGIFASDGETWRRHRKTSSHIFTTRNFKDKINSVIAEDTHRLVDILAGTAASGAVLDLHAVFHNFTLDSFGKIGFSTSFNCLESPETALPFAAAFDKAFNLLLIKSSLPLRNLVSWVTGMDKEINRLVAIIDEFAYEQIRLRRSGVKSADDGRMKDLLDLFMEHPGTDGNPVTDKELRDMLLNMILAGRDTTAGALSWAIYSIARRPDIIANMRKEIQEKKKLPNHIEPTPPTSFNETLRLYPSVPLELKVALKPDVLPGGISIPAGTEVLWSLYAMGRHPSVWGPTAADFDPERWLVRDPATGAVAALKRESVFRWPVFNAGPRTCLGQQMATVEAVIVLTALVARFDVELVAPQEVAYRMSLTLPMKDGLKVRLTDRAA